MADAEAEKEKLLLDPEKNEDKLELWKQRCSYETQMTTYHYSLLMFGMLYKERDQNGDTTWKCNLGKVYHKIVVLLLWVNFIRFGWSYDFGEPFGLEMSTKIIAHIFLLWGAIGATTGKNLMKERPEIFKKWNAYIENHNIVHKPEFYATQKRRIKLVTIFCWLMFLMYVCCTIDMDFDPHLHYFLRVMLIPLVDPCGKEKTAYPELVAAVSILDIINGSVIIFQLCYVYLMTRGIADEFSQYNRDFQAAIISWASGRSLLNLEEWRRRHRELTAIVGHIDSGFGLYVLLVFGINIPVCSVLLHRIILSSAHNASDPGFGAVLGQMAAHLVVSFGIMLVINSIGSTLSVEAQMARGFLYNMELQGPYWTDERIFQYTLFYNRLSQGHIGITAWRLFNINKENVKTSILLVIAYTVLLARFASRPHGSFLCTPEEEHAEEGHTDYYDY